MATDPLSPSTQRFLQSLARGLGQGTPSEAQIRAVTKALGGAEDAFDATAKQVDQVAAELKLKPHEKSAVVFALLLSKVGPELGARLKNELAVANSMKEALGKLMKHVQAAPSEKLAQALERFYQAYAGPNAAQFDSGLEVIPSRGPTKLLVEGDAQWISAPNDRLSWSDVSFSLSDKAGAKVGFFDADSSGWCFHRARSEKPVGEPITLEQLGTETLEAIANGAAPGNKSLATTAWNRLAAAAQEVLDGRRFSYADSDANPFGRSANLKFTAQVPPAPKPHQNDPGAFLLLQRDKGPEWVFRPAEKGKLDPAKDVGVGALSIHSLARLRERLLEQELARDPLSGLNGGGAQPLSSLLIVISSALDQKVALRKQQLERAEAELRMRLADFPVTSIQRDALNQLVRGIGLA